MTTTMREPLHVEVWGAGEPVVMIHGSLATGADEWSAQRPLAEHGYRLLVLDRRGYGNSPAAGGEDFLVDADDVIALMGDGAHLVGHSYGGLAALYAAGRNPAATLSLTLLEAPALTLVPDHPDVRAFDDAVRRHWSAEMPDEQWVVEFLTLVGSDPTQLPPDLIEVATAMTPVFRNGRPYFTADPPFAAVAAGNYPKLVVSGGHNEGFEAMCAALADRIGGQHIVVPGAGHEIQFVGAPLNECLLQLWSDR